MYCLEWKEPLNSSLLTKQSSDRELPPKATHAKSCGSLCIEGSELVAAAGTWGFTGCSCMSRCVKPKHVVEERGCIPKAKRKIRYT